MSETPSIFRTRVVRTERLTPHMVRVVLGGDDLAAFPDNGCTDRYVKLLFPRPGQELAPGVNPRALPPEERPVFRTYTIRSIDPSAHEVTIDFVVHGGGVAGPWAAAAQPGDELLMTPPGGAYAPRADVDLHLLVGDEAALPAIASALEALPPDVATVVLLEVDGAEDELELSVGPSVELRWVHRSDGGGQDALIDAVRALDTFPARTQVFAHGELAMIRQLQRHLLDDRSVDRELLSASGYWRRGKTEEGFQQEKRELAAADAAAD